MRERHMRISVVAFVAAAVATMLVAFVLPGAATSAPPGCANRTNNTYDKLLECVTLEGVRAHQAALQATATANGGTRVKPERRATPTASRASRASSRALATT